jgi:hypothetical protein
MVLHRPSELAALIRHVPGIAPTSLPGLFPDSGKLWRTGQVGWQSHARRRWHEPQVHLNRERVGNPAEPRDGGVSDRKRPMECDTKRQVDAQSDGGGSESVAANHPAAVPDRVASQNELHGEPGRYNPSRAEREKSRGSDPTGLRMRRDPQGSAPAKQDGAAVDPSQEAMAIPAAFAEARDKLQRTRQQGDRATQGVQRKRYAPLAEVIELRGKGHVRQQVTKSLQRVRQSEERKQIPQDLRQGSHVDSFCHVSSIA